MKTKRVARFADDDEAEQPHASPHRLRDGVASPTSPSSSSDPPDWPADSPSAEMASSHTATSTSPHRRLHQPARGCLKSASSSSSSSSSAAPFRPASSHAAEDEEHHVHFLSSSGTSLMASRSTSPPPSRPSHVAIDLHKLLLHHQQQPNPTLVYRPVPFGMLRARHTYATRFAVLGGHGRTQVDCVEDDIAAEMSVCKEPSAAKVMREDDEEMFEIIFRPTTRGPFEGSFYLTVSAPASSAPDFMHTESRDMAAVPTTASDVEAETIAPDISDNKKRKRDTQPEPQLQRHRLRVVVTAQILKKGMGKPSLRDGVRCIALDEEEDSDADSDWANGYQ